MGFERHFVWELASLFRFRILLTLLLWNRDSSLQNTRSPKYISARHQKAEKQTFQKPRDSSLC